MVYLTKSKRGKKTYYYLAENITLADGTRKALRKYIGVEEPTDTMLKMLISEFEKEVDEEKMKIHGYHYLAKEEIQEIDRINSEFWKRYNKQNNIVQEQFDENFAMAFVYNTNSIEGSTLTPKEVALLLAENISPNKNLDDVLEAKAAQKALYFVKDYKGEFNEQFLLTLHEIYFKETKPKIAGKYKTLENYIRGSSFKLTPPELVPTDMKLYFQEYKKLEKELHPLELAAWCHWKIARIHPFQDGNGRIARLTMNYILHKNSYAMIDIKTQDKKRYFKSMDRCNYNNNARPLANRLIKRFTKQYQNALKN